MAASDNVIKINYKKDMGDYISVAMDALTCNISSGDSRAKIIKDLDSVFQHVYSQRLKIIELDNKNRRLLSEQSELRNTFEQVMEEVIIAAKCHGIETEARNAHDIVDDVIKQLNANRELCTLNEKMYYDSKNEINLLNKELQSVKSDLNWYKSIFDRYVYCPLEHDNILSDIKNELNI